MKQKRSLLLRWCPQPERMKVTRIRPTDRSLLTLVASAVILSLLAIQGIQMSASPAVNAAYPSNYGAFPVSQPGLPGVEALNQTTATSDTVTTVSTDHFTVQFTFPQSAYPGSTVTISATTTAKSSKRIESLSIEVFVYANQQLAKAATATVLTDKSVRSGDTWKTTLTPTIPLNANRSIMIGTVDEVWEQTSTDYYSSYYYWPYYYYPYYYPPYPSNYTYYYIVEPSYTTVRKSSEQTLPLTYVLATTPEYEALSAQYKELQQEYDALTAKHNELSSQYDQLQSNYKQLESQYNAATMDRDAYRAYTYVLIVVSAGLAAALAFLVFQKRGVIQPLESPDKRGRRAAHQEQGR